MEKMSLWVNIESHLNLQAIIFFAPASFIERYMEDAIFRFHETKKDDSIMAATNFVKNIVSGDRIQKSFDQKEL